MVQKKWKNSSIEWPFYRKKLRIRNILIIFGVDCTIIPISPYFEQLVDTLWDANFRFLDKHSTSITGRHDTVKLSLIRAKENNRRVYS